MSDGPHNLGIDNLDAEERLVPREQHDFQIVFADHHGCSLDIAEAEARIAVAGSDPVRRLVAALVEAMPEIENAYCWADNEGQGFAFYESPSIVMVRRTLATVRKMLEAKA